MWIAGASGTGKTILSSTIIDKLAEDYGNNTAIAFFYFDFTDKAKQTMDMALWRIILQLSRQCPNAYYSLSTEQRSSGSVTIPTWDKLLAIFEKLLKELKRTYLILDALDECRAEDHELVVDFLRTILRWPDIRLHILVTSQPREIFATGLGTYENTVRIQIREDTTSNDISLFVGLRQRVRSRRCKKIQRSSLNAGSGLYLFSVLQT
ncbi:hypothetical protein C8R47DRAFT_660542 [Mycena vitilis]|nr:hypothetical protein C8R47DRAFT_660542 [Mycena vitilis]